MAQEPSRSEAVNLNMILRDRSRELNEVRWDAVRTPELSVRLIRAYQRYLQDHAGEPDPAGPAGMVEFFPRLDRFFVAGHLTATTAQVDQVRGAVEAAGGAVHQVEDDPRIGVSLLSVAGLQADQLADLVLELRATTVTGHEPVEVGLDDVTYQNVNLKPVTPHASGAAARAALVATRPTGTGRGSGVTIGVIDGGFESDTAPPRTDGWFDNVVPPPDGRPPLNQVDPSTLDPGAGHGTFVTGIIVSHAPDATIRQYRAADSYGFGDSWRLKDQILQAVADGCQVVNISLGFEDPGLLGSPAVSAALHHVPSSVLVVAAAGNAGSPTPMLPASHKVTIGVGGLDADLDPVGWSNRGPWVDFSALAVPVLSTYVVDPTVADPDPNPFGIWAGTSFSAPKVTGELAVLLGQGLSPTQAVDVLRTRAARPQPSPDFGYLLQLPDQFHDEQLRIELPWLAFRLPRQIQLPDLGGVIGR